MIKANQYDFITMKAIVFGRIRPMRIDNEASMIDIWHDEESEWIWSDEATDNFLKRRGKLPSKELDHD